MLKINLLPPYINQRSKIRTAWTVLAVLLAAELVGLTLVQAKMRADENSLIASVQAQEAKAIQVESLAREAQTERAKIDPIKQKKDFIEKLWAYNKVRPNLYERVASYIYQEVWIAGMQAEQNI